MTALAFTVVGTPKPKGSKRHVGNGILVESAGEALVDWSQAVATTAAQARVRAGCAPVADPCRVQLTFRLPRPKSNPKRRETLPSRKPDIDKLARAVLDALTAAGLLTDDAVVVELVASKEYADRADPWTGCRVEVVVFEGMAP